MSSMKICEGLELDPRSFHEQVRGLRHVPRAGIREAASPDEGKEVFKAGHMRVVALPPGTRMFGLDFLITFDTGYEVTQEKTLAKAKSTAKKYDKKWPKPGDWFKTPRHSYGKKKLIPAKVVSVKPKHSDYVVRFTRHIDVYGQKPRDEEFDIPLSLLMYEGSKMRKPPKGAK